MVLPRSGVRTHGLPTQSTHESLWHHGERALKVDDDACLCSVWMDPMPPTHNSPTHASHLDAESATWIERLQSDGPGYEAAVKDLHVLPLEGKPDSRCIGADRRLERLRDSDHEDLAQQSADDALMAVLRKLGDFRGDSRFTTWALQVRPA